MQCTNPIQFGPHITVCDDKTANNRFDAGESIRIDGTPVSPNHPRVQDALRKLGAQTFAGVPLTQGNELLSALRAMEGQVINGFDVRTELQRAETAATNIGPAAQHALRGHLLNLRDEGMARAERDIASPAIHVRINRDTGRHEPEFARHMATILRNDNALRETSERIIPQQPVAERFRINFRNRREKLIGDAIGVQIAVLYHEAARAALLGKPDKVFVYLQAADHSQFVFPHSTHEGHSLREARNMRLEQDIQIHAQTITALKADLDNPGDEPGAYARASDALRAAREEMAPFVENLRRQAFGD